MRTCKSQDGLTVRAIAGTYSILIGIDLQEAKRAGCLGFSIHRLDLGPSGAPVPPAQQQSRWLPNMLRFPKDTADADETPSTSDRSPIQKFRWGDWTGHPGLTYRYTVTAQYGQWNQLVPGPSVSVEVTTEDPANPNTAVYFNRGAAASNAYNVKFGSNDPGKLPADQQQKAYTWLSRGLEEAILGFLSQARDNTYSLHAAIYEFQKPNLLQGLKDALGRGVDVRVVYHYRHKKTNDTTWTENAAAAQAAGLDLVCVQRKANPNSAISHNKFVVLLKDNVPQAVWTGSTNWTEGAIYGQLNLGHAIYDPAIAQTYENYFQLLHADTDYGPIKDALGKLTPVPKTLPPGPCILPILSPQSQKDMLDLYASICDQADSLMVSAPFKLSPEILTSLKTVSAGRLRYLLIDKTGSLGSKQELDVISGDSGNEVSVATTLSSPLHDFQNKLLEGQESYHHAGVHIHSKLIAADPLGPDPVIVFGSANFSDNSTLNNDSNSLIIRGNTAVADIYVTEFMRMFEHYYFRGRQAQVAVSQPLGLAEDDSWSAQFYVAGSSRATARRLFAGTDEAGNPPPGSG
jgi:phosphatidylserine/phosphatidylglycerophosphate/cardiolipin synthase-like enzyme